MRNRLCFAGAVLGLTLAMHAGPALAHGRPDAGVIAFVSDRDSTSQAVIDDVYLMDPATRRTERVTYDRDLQSMPALSPDGRSLGYIYIPLLDDVGQLNQAELRTCRLVKHRGHLSCGQERRLVAAGRIVATSPFAWTADSRTILYAGYDETTGDADIFSVRTRGDRAPVNLTQEGSGEPTVFDAQPSVAPRDRYFVYGSNGDIMRRDLDGRGLVRLTSGPRVDVVPEVSPDGRRLVFQVNAPGDFDVYTMAARPEDDRNPAVNLTAGRTDPSGKPVQERFPTWSPDGSRIGYQRHVEYDPANPFYSGLSDSEIYSMRADGSDERNLTANDAASPPIGDIMPDWSAAPHQR